MARTMRAGVMMTMVAWLGAACQAGRESSAKADHAPSAASATGTHDTAAATSTPVTAKRPTVLFIGTSLTAGYGLDDPATQAYPAQVGVLADSAGLPIHVVNAGVSGETSAGALQRVGWLLRQQADIIVLETGANDGLRGLSVDAARTNISAILERLKAAKPGVPLVLVQMEAPPNLGSTYVTRFHAMYGDVARAEGAALTPFLLGGVAGVQGLNQPDGVHPTASGAKVAAKTVWGTLAPIVRAWDAEGKGTQRNAGR